jgi:indolepyruvate ferredoxin oxidoreductase beta subunit
MDTSVILVGVGGQGTILTSKILAEGLLRAGYDVKMSEIHGMSQRGGSVTTHIKFGERIFSPVICRSEADVMVAFEKVEALRYLDYLKPGGRLIINDQEIYSQSVLSGNEAYPEGILESLKATVSSFISVQAAEMAERIGNIRSQNIILLGVLVRSLGLQDIDWVKVMKDSMPEKIVDVNLKAFECGITLPVEA